MDTMLCTCIIIIIIFCLNKGFGHCTAQSCCHYKQYHNSWFFFAVKFLTRKQVTSTKLYIQRINDTFAFNFIRITISDSKFWHSILTCICNLLCKPYYSIITLFHKLNLWWFLFFNMFPTMLCTDESQIINYIPKWPIEIVLLLIILLLLLFCQFQKYYILGSHDHIGVHILLCNDNNNFYPVHTHGLYAY